MKHIKARGVLLFIVMLFLLVTATYSQNLFAADEQLAPKGQNTKIDIDYNREDKDVGLKRMEILDKLLSPELLEKKRALVHSIESDYNNKISTLLQRLTTPISRNTVITHIDINFFDHGFDSQVHATQKVSVSVILDRNGITNWVSENKSEHDAIEEIKRVIYSTFNIPMENISIIKAPD